MPTAGRTSAIVCRTSARLDQLRHLMKTATLVLLQTKDELVVHGLVCPQ